MIRDEPVASTATWTVALVASFAVTFTHELSASPLVVRALVPEPLLVGVHGGVGHVNPFALSVEVTLPGIKGGGMVIHFDPGIDHHLDVTILMRG